MQGLLFNITASFFFLVFAVNSALWLKIWEEREYKWKRVFIHLRDTKQGRNILFGTESILKWLAVLVYAATIFIDGFDRYYHLLVFALYSIIVCKIAWKAYNRNILLPSFSLNNFLILFLSFLCILFLFIFPPLDKFLWLLVLDKIIPLFIAFFVALFLVFFDFNSDIIINKAIGKIAKHKNLLSIAVVGSYGKGSTKEFISRILLSKFNILETNTAFNDALGISQTIINKLSSKKQIFIAEMDDYKIGDIRDMSAIIQPKIAVVTGINDQKISIFGNIGRILVSKYEVVESIPRDGLLIFNGNNTYSLDLYKKTSRKKFIYATDESKVNNPDIKALNIKEGKFSLSFDVHAFGRKYKLSNIKLLGKQNIENLLPGIFIGLYLGLDFSLMRKEIEKLRPLPKTMEPSVTARNVVLVNDTYNANVNSVRRALEYMKLYKGRKILVLEPLIELGKNAYSDHYALGIAIGEVCDYLFLTNDNYYEPLVKGVQNATSLCIVGVLPPGKIVEFVEDEARKDDVIVFEGEEAAASLSALTSESVH